MEEEPEPTTYGPYRVLRKIGSGGMGTVYEARHELLGRLVALKTIGERLPLTQESRARFLREARAAAKVGHRNVVQVHDVSVEGNVPYMVLELLHGQTLASLLQTEVVLSAEKAADLLVPLVAGVAAAHASGIVHRDLKPQNLFISEQHSTLVPRVLDFGISKLIDEEVPVHTRSDVILGTAPYMSPEQARGSKNLDSRSDQYALGAVLYECVTGRKPFEDDNLYLLINRIAAGDFKRPSEVYSGVAPELEAVVMKAMSLEPSDRYATTALFGQALLAFASYKTRTNYAQEFGEFSAIASTEPHDVTDFAAHRDVAEDFNAATEQNTPTSKGTPARVNNANPTDQPNAYRSTFSKPRQVAVAIALLCVGVGVGYSFKFASRVSSAAEPAEQTDTALSNHAAPTVSVVAGTSDGPQSTVRPVPTEPPATAPIAPAPGSSAAWYVVNSARPSESPVATSPPFVQKVRSAPPAPKTPGTTSATNEQNRAQMHGLVQETPF